ncbi:MAG: Glutamate--tRNA ligase [Methanomassiliicoccales archaeon PtaB.Bin215]|nr:MAG: Glutamate--tRNA ligase [Methanomassiliicoccales archaeon PtaB.Bin215]
MSEDLEATIRKYALQNAVLYAGKANPKAVQGKVLAESPELRSRVREVLPLIASIVEEVNSLAPEVQHKQLEDIDASMLKREKAERRVGLPELPNMERGKVVMRFAPGPSGPLHLGHTRVAILNDDYCRNYDGKFINRMEDTNPDKIDPNAYDMIPEDLDWLGVKVHETVVQSDRFELYYDIARQLINMGKAYVCTCPAEDWRALKEKGQPCPHHDEDVATTMEKFDKMLAGDYEEEKAIFVVKTDLNHPNPAIRDFVGLRIVKSTPHPLKGDRYCLYPMMNFSVAIDDHFLGLTHVLRGKDHLNNTQRQAYLFKYFGWKVPHYTHYGLVSVPDAILKTSTVGKGIKSGEYSGWDDVRLGTVRALAKRGFRPEAIRNYWVDCGIKETDVEFSWDNIYAYNKAIVDKTANRYFFVWDPVPLQVCGVNELKASAPRHPDRPELGNREFQLNSPIIIHVVEKDLNTAMEAGKVRLKDLGNVEFRSGKALYQGNDLSVLKEGYRIIHWVPDNCTPATVFMPTGEKKDGFAENLPKEEEGKVVQFERFGFVKVEKVSPKLIAYFTH